MLRALGLRQAADEQQQHKSVEERLESIEKCVRAMEMRMMSASAIFKDHEVLRWLVQEVEAWRVEFDAEYGLRKIEHLRDEWLLSRFLSKFEEPKNKWQLLMGQLLLGMEEESKKNEAMKAKLSLLQTTRAKEKSQNPETPDHELCYQWLPPEGLKPLVDEEERAMRQVLARAVLKR